MKGSVDKIGIVTLYGNLNYGNRLQNYAMHTLLSRRGYEVQTLVCKKRGLKTGGKMLRDRLQCLLGNTVAKRKAAFDRFSRQSVPTRTLYTENGLIPDGIREQYRYFVVGSDQVWNPEIRKKERKNFFLQFARQEQRVAVAPSIGVSEIPAEYREEFAGYFAGFDHLSCREAAGAADIAALSGKPCAHIIDPTLAITAEEWREFARPLPIKEKYIVVFYLGDRDATLWGKITAFAEQNGCRIVDLANPSDRFYVSDPKEFVWLIDHAQMVFTDSFHATAFSINLHTPFYVFDRHQKQAENNHTGSRIHSLVNLFELEDRFIEHGIPERIETCDFTAADEQFVKEREAFQRYLDSCFI